MKVLVAGGAGFIGNTIASACLDDGIVPVVLDNLSTGRAEFVRDRIFYHGDIADAALIGKIFAEHPDIGAVVHCAALIVVPDSMADPLPYYRENVAKTVKLLDAVIAAGCTRFLFSPSASIYQPGRRLRRGLGVTARAASPYAWTKAMGSRILADCALAYPLRVLSLRYFNPIGADPAMRTGLQHPRPSHVLGKLIEANERGEPFPLTGTDWPTRDGSGIRDYIHAWDLARAHVLALRRFDAILPAEGTHRHYAINLGTGHGTTVRELARAFQAVVGQPIEVRTQPRRPGDSAGSFTRSRRSYELLGWQPTLSLEDGVRHSLQWKAVRDRVLEP